MKFERTEDEVIGKAPIKVRLGDVDYEVKPLSMTPQRKWRQKYVAAIFPLLNSFKGQSLEDAMSKGLACVLVQFPEKLEELLFEYSQELRDAKDKITDEEDGATEEQVAAAFSRIMVVAYPFLPQLETATKLWRSAQSTPPSL